MCSTASKGRQLCLTSQELEKDRLDLAAQNQQLAAELEKLKLSQAKKKGPKGKNELERFVDLRILVRVSLFQTSWLRQCGRV